MKRKIFKRIIAFLMLMLCVVSLSACGKHNASKKVKDTSLPTGEYFASTSQAKQVDQQRGQMLKQVAAQMSKNYKKIGKVNYSKAQNNISLHLTGSQMSNLIQYAQNHNRQAMKFWQQMTTGMQKSSKVISDQSHDTNLQFRIFSPNGNKLIYAAKNGRVINNAFK